ncbi:MAG TPA: hypothetical protein VGC27_02515, partial [Rhizomicrobium sp.]
LTPQTANSNAPEVSSACSRIGVTSCSGSYAGNINRAQYAMRVGGYTPQQLAEVPVVMSAINQAWYDSNPNAVRRNLKREAHFYVLQDKATGKISVSRITLSSLGAAEWTPPPPPRLATAIVLADFHTHPWLESDFGFPVRIPHGPSGGEGNFPGDIDALRYKRIPLGNIRDHTGLVFYDQNGVIGNGH